MIIIDNNLIFNFIEEAINTKDSTKRILYSNDNFFISKEKRNTIKKYLRNIAPEDQQKIYNIIKEFNANQLALFFENIRYLNKFHKDPVLLLQDARGIKKGLFQNRIFSINPENACLETYMGFMRALKAGTLYSLKIKINGKLKRVFAKTPIGYNPNENLGAGFNKLLIDPETMKVYSFIVNRFGRIEASSIIEKFSLDSLKKEIVDFDNTTYEIAKITKDSFFNFRKELLNRIDSIYGIEKVVDTFLRMGGKINPDKYSNPEFRAEMIKHLEEKFGTDKLLKWSSKIKDPKKAAEAKLEILNVLSRKFGKDYERFYNSHKKTAEKAIKIQKLKQKPIKIRRL